MRASRQGNRPCALSPSLSKLLILPVAAYPAFPQFENHSLCKRAPAAYNHISPPAVQHLVCVQNGETPLYVASENGHTDVVKELLSRGADIGQR